MNKVSALFAKLDFSKTLAISAVVAGAYYFWMYNDGSLLENNIKTINGQISAEEAKKKNTEKVLAEASQFKSEIGSLGEKFKSASEKLPTEFKAQQLIDMINATAKDAGIKVVNLQPGAVIKKLNYDEIPVKVKLRGSYGNIVVFLYFMGSMERITHIRNFAFQNDQNESKAGLLGFEANIVSFRFRADEGDDESKSSVNASGGK
jgi:type IV pilus assembly protein PilO